MKRILLVIFFIAMIISLIIYKISYKKNYNILFLGEFNNIKELKIPNNYETNTFIYENITYKELIKSIKYNDYIIVKGKKIYLNQLINNSDYIFIKAEQIEYKNKCNKSNKVFNNYLNIINDNIDDLKKMINRISHAKVIIVNNRCGV